MPTLAQLLDSLEAFHGPQLPDCPIDPYRFLVWWHCGYPASDAACAKGWASLTSRFQVDPESLLAANAEELAEALKPGGMVPELRAIRLKEIAVKVQKEFDGDLCAALRRMPLAKARTALKKFPGIADPGADRILLFAGIAPLPAVPSNCPHVLLRIHLGYEPEKYAVAYAEAQKMISNPIPEKLDARCRAYLLIKRHGQEICKRTNPKCTICPWPITANGRTLGLEPRLQPRPAISPSPGDRGTSLIFSRRIINVIDDKNIGRKFRCVEPESQLLPDRCEETRCRPVRKTRRQP
jgi:endonuclease-3